MTWAYVARAGRIYVKTLTTAGTWYQVLTEEQCKGIRGFKIKSRMSYDSSGNPTGAPKPFDMAFTNTPDAGDNTTTGLGYWSNSGSGSGDEAAVSTGLWCQGVVDNTIIECLTYD